MVRRVKVDKAVSIGHQIGLKTKNAIYPYRKAEMNAHSINVGAKTFYKENLFQDYRLPKFVLISFKTTDKYTINIKMIPHHSVILIYLPLLYQDIPNIEKHIHKISIRIIILLHMLHQ